MSLRRMLLVRPKGDKQNILFEVWLLTIYGVEVWPIRVDHIREESDIRHTKLHLKLE